MLVAADRGGGGSSGARGVVSDDKGGVQGIIVYVLERGERSWKIRDKNENYGFLIYKDNFLLVNRVLSFQFECFLKLRVLGEVVKELP